MTYTATTTVSSPLVLPLAAKQVPFSQRVESSLESLAEILDLYADWDDHLSRRIFGWGAEVLSIDEQKNWESEAELEALALERIDYLRHKILVNPLDKKPLQIPLLDKEWVWEKAMLEEWQQNFLHSLFHDGEISSIPHDFASAMIEWVRQEDLAEESLVLYDKGQLWNPTRLFTYKLWAQRAMREVAQESTIQLRQAIEQSQAAMMQFVEETLAQQQQSEKEFLQKQKEFESKTEQQLEDIKETNQATVGIWHERVSRLQGALNDEEERRSNSDKRGAKMEEEIQDLKKDNYDLWVRVEKASKEASKKSKRCKIM